MLTVHFECYTYFCLSDAHQAIVDYQVAKLITEMNLHTRRSGMSTKRTGGIALKINLCLTLMRSIMRVCHAFLLRSGIFLV